MWLGIGNLLFITCKYHIIHIEINIINDVLTAYRLMTHERLVIMEYGSGLK